MSEKTEKFSIEKRQKVEIEPLLPVIQNLTAQGYNLADIGMILGYSGKDKKNWLWRLKENHPEIQEAIEAGKNLADVELVKTAFKEATGYTIEEVETNYKAFPDPDNPTKVRWVAIEKKSKPKYIPPKTVLLWKMLCSRLPDYFVDSKKIEINKTSLEIKDITAAEIRRFAGRFAKMVDSEVIDTNFMEIENEKSNNKKI